MEFQQEPIQDPRGGQGPLRSRCRSGVAPSGDCRSKLQQSLPPAQRDHSKPRSRPLVTIAHEELRYRAFSYAPNGKRDTDTIRQLSRLGVHRRRAREEPQNEALDPEYRGGVKRKDKIRQRDAPIYGDCKAVARPAPTLRAKTALIRPKQRIFGHGTLRYGEQ
jgi:hypothetical protein